MGRLDFVCHIVNNLNWTEMVIVNVCLNVVGMTKFSSLISIWMDKISEILWWSSLKNSRGWIRRNTAWEQNQMKNIWCDFGLLLVAESVYQSQVTSRVLVLLQALVKKGWQCFLVVTCPCHDKHWTKQIFFPRIFWK